MNTNQSKLPDIRKTRVLDNPIYKVWKAVTTSEGIALWFVANDFQLLEGHEFHMDMHKPQGMTTCKLMLVDTPKRLTYDLGSDWSWTFELVDLGDQTELTFIWSGWDANKSTEFGMSHTTIHSQLLQGTNVLMKSLARSIKKI
ncbi:SRPBCC family protein [Pseudalkalibacillus decolorationis]|uniref:SRPBCC family protein n=1 Tax=Pseudalkalibacillus decolorationis TaxID=163879 RepID=UPI0021474A2B|nr:SRPBCC domain-containing protein [Pseudalkalibacillus decolorationis]